MAAAYCSDPLEDRPCDRALGLVTRDDLVVVAFADGFEVVDLEVGFVVVDLDIATVLDLDVTLDFEAAEETDFECFVG